MPPRSTRSSTQVLVFLFVLLMSVVAQAQSDAELIDVVGSGPQDTQGLFFHDEEMQDEVLQDDEAYEEVWHRPRLFRRISNWLCGRFHYGYGDPDFPGRHVGLGVPMTGSSWLNRPYHADAFVGGLFGDELVAGVATQEGGVFSGVRLGWDSDHFWGVESRLAFASPPLAGTASKVTVQIFDAQLMYYPWGDAHWRPFFSIGSGIARYTAPQAGISEVAYHLPLGVGLKYYFRKPVALRVELMENIAFASPSTINNVSLTASLEWHFGGRRRSYYPYESSLRLW